MTARNKMVNGEVVALSSAELAVVADPARMETARQRHELRQAKLQAKVEQATVEKQAVQYFIRGETFPTELKEYHAALGDVISGKAGGDVALPVKPMAMVDSYGSKANPTVAVLGAASK